MSKESLTLFYERLSQDEKMQQEYNEAIARGLLESAAAFATARGFDLSPEDLGDKLQSRANELSEDELGKVAGGARQESSMGLSAVGFAKLPRPGNVLSDLLNLDGKGN